MECCCCSVTYGCVCMTNMCLCSTMQPKWIIMRWVSFPAASNLWLMKCLRSFVQNSNVLDAGQIRVRRIWCFVPRGSRQRISSITCHSCAFLYLCWCASIIRNACSCDIRILRDMYSVSHLLIFFLLIKFRDRKNYNGDTSSGRSHPWIENEAGNRAAVGGLPFML